MKIFLGGTVGKNDWRKKFIQFFTDRGIDQNIFVDPTDWHWDEKTHEKEELEKHSADIVIFYLGNPKQEGNLLSAYSMVEATMFLYDKPNSTIAVFDTEEMSGHPLASLKQTEEVLRQRFPNAHIFNNLNKTSNFLLSDHLQG